jgi:hypothetical protein
MFQQAVLKLSESLNQLVKDKIEISGTVDDRKVLTDFGKRKEHYTMQNFLKSLDEVKKSALELGSSPITKQIHEILPGLETKDKLLLRKRVNELLELSKQAPSESQRGEFLLQVPQRMPREIADEVIADIRELERCYANHCFRSAVILCGRLLETALHRKYFEVTGFDILEKNPGIGLGNLIAKLAEKNVQLDPGLTQQIHIVNQVRIFSVHKKKESFYPSKEQTMAIILYTMDSLKKLF